MKKYNLILLIILVCTSCMTTYNYERLTSDDCLVIIPTGIDRPKGTDIARTYTIEVSGTEQVLKVPKKVSGFTCIKIRKDSQDIQAIKSRVTNSNYSGKSSNKDFFKELPYKPGSAVVCDFRIIQKIVKESERSYFSSIDFMQISEEEKNHLLEDLKNTPEYSSWFE